MNFTKTVARNSIKKLFSEKWQLLMFLLIPVIMGGLFSLISGPGSQPKPQGVLLVTDDDDTLLSQFVIAGFSRGPVAEMFTTKVVKEDQAQSLMNDGKASVWLMIDKGFSKDYLDNKPTSIKLVKNPSQNILPQIAETIVTIMADAGHYIQLLFTDELQQFNQLINGDKISDLQMATMSVAIKNTIDNFENQLFPPQIKAVKKNKEKTATDNTSNKSFMYYMFPGLLFMSILFASQGMALEFWKDKSQGITQRLLSSPSGITDYLNGNMIAHIGIYGLIALIIGSLGLLMLGLAMSKILILLGWTVLSGLVIGSMMTVMILLMPTQKSASVVSLAMVFPLMMLGGSFFPFETMPKWMVLIGQYLPNGYMLQNLNYWFLDNEPMTVLIKPAIFAMIVLILLWFINKNLILKFARR